VFTTFGALLLFGSLLAHLMLTTMPSGNAEWMRLYVYVGVAWTGAIGVVVAQSFGFRGLFFVVIGGLFALSGVFLYVAFSDIVGFELNADSTVVYKRWLGFVMGLAGLAFFLAAASLPKPSLQKQRA